MAKLAREYIDIKDKRHKVEHQTLLSDDQKRTDQIMEELFRVMVKHRGRPVSA